MNVVPFLVPPRYPHPPVAGVDPFRDDLHEGSDDLALWCPSAVELHYAWRVWRDPADVDAARHLRSVAQSPARMVALVGLIRREAEAQALLKRVAP